MMMDETKGDRLRLGDLARHEIIVVRLRLRAQCRVSAGILKDFDRTLVLDERTKLVAKKVTEFQKESGDRVDR